MMMKKLGILLVLCITSTVFLVDATVQQSVVKPLVRKRNSGEVKQEIARSVKKALTLSSSLIASVATQIDELIEKIEELASGDDTYFSQQKAQKLDEYLRKLNQMVDELEAMLEAVHSNTEKLHKNFSTN